MGLILPQGRGHLLKTGLATAYHAGDDQHYQKGLSRGYIVGSTGAYSGNTNIDLPSYAGATLAFDAATKKITDTANGLATFKTADTITVRGSVGNDGTYTVAVGNVAGEIVVNEAVVDEAAGAYISLCKREAHLNNVVTDQRTRLMWSRRVAGSVGPTSDGTMPWYNAAYAFALHPAAADLQMIAATRTLKIVGGAGEVARYHVGDCIVCAGFANAVNNRRGYVVESVTVNAADLDIVLSVFGATLLDEAAAGARSISLICQSVFAYCAAANLAALSGFSDWRVPNLPELMSLANSATPGGGDYPDTTAFPVWPEVVSFYTSTTYRPPVQAYRFRFTDRMIDYVANTTASYLVLVRG